MVASVALLVGACGDDDAEPASSPSDTTPAPTAAQATAPAPTTAAGVEAPELAGTDWNVTLYSLGNSMTNVWPGTQVTISFGADGTISGSGGCNEYGGTYETSGPYDEFEDGVRDPNDGQAITFALGGITERACEAQNTMDQEGEFIALFDQVGRWVIVRGNLSIRDAEGFFVFEGEPL